MLLLVEGLVNVNYSQSVACKIEKKISKQGYLHDA